MKKTDAIEPKVAESVPKSPSLGDKIIKLSLQKPSKIIAILLLLVFVAGITYWRFPKRKVDSTIAADSGSFPPDPIIIAKRVDEAKKKGNLRVEAEEQIINNNFAQADALYDTAIKNEPDVTKKIELYLNLSAVYYKHNIFDKTIAVVGKASGLSEDQFLVADWLSRVYEDKQDYAQAAKYYLLAAQWADSPQNDTGINKADYEASAIRVRGLSQ